MPSTTSLARPVPVPGVRMVARRDFLVAGAAAAAGVCATRRYALAESTPPVVPTPEMPAAEPDMTHMREALKLMRQAGVVDRTGGPFGAVVVLDGKVLAAAGNSVMRDRDPTAHAEVNAIREACRKVGNPHISGAVLYSSCEPCPMCYATAFWARVHKIFYGASWDDFSDLFDDANISKDLVKPYPERKVALQQILRSEAQKVWEEFRQLPDGARY